MWGLSWLLLAGLTTGALAQEALTTKQMEALSPRSADRVANQGLLSILQPVGEVDPGRFRTPHGVAVETGPVGIEYDGLCRKAAISLRG